MIHVSFVALKVCVRCGLVVARELDDRRVTCPGCAKDLEPLKADLSDDGKTVVFYTEEDTSI